MNSENNPHPEPARYDEEGHFIGKALDERQGERRVIQRHKTLEGGYLRQPQGGSLLRSVKYDERQADRRSTQAAAQSDGASGKGLHALLREVRDYVVYDYENGHPDAIQLMNRIDAHLQGLGAEAGGK